MSKLATASDVVCLLTQKSLDRPWILYEAGVAKGKLDTPVYGVALGMPLRKANSGPFAQFQNCDDDEESLTKLVMQLVRRIPGSEPDHDAIRTQVQTFKDRANEVLAGVGETSETLEKQPLLNETPVEKLFEEIKIMFQDLPSRLEGSLMTGVDHDRGRQSRLINPTTIQDMIRNISKGPTDPIFVAIIASTLRDKFPWIYDIGMDAYRVALSEGAKAART